jgi:hypothetical protein
MRAVQPELLFLVFAPTRFDFPSFLFQGVNFGRLDIEVLKRYKKHYKQHVKVKNQNSKPELVDAIHRHFGGRDFPIPNYNDVLPEFLKTCKRKQKDKD